MTNTRTPDDLKAAGYTINEYQLGVFTWTWRDGNYFSISTSGPWSTPEEAIANARDELARESERN